MKRTHEDGELICSSPRSTLTSPRKPRIGSIQRSPVTLPPSFPPTVAANHSPNTFFASISNKFNSISAMAVEDAGEQKASDVFQILTVPMWGTRCSTPVASSSSTAQQSKVFSPISPPSSSRSLSHYNVIRALGTGVFSEVFQVQDKLTHKIYAMKRSRHDSMHRTDEIKRSHKNFQMEFEVLRLFNSPHVPTLFDSWEEDQHFHMLLQCAVCSLQDLLDRQREKGSGLIKEGMVWRLLGEAAEALGEVHRREVVHLDVKPANLLISDTGVLQVTDFGQAFVKGRKVGCEGDVRYMARELPLCEHWSPQPSADIFSLGLTFYLLLRCVSEPSYSLPSEGEEWTALRGERYTQLEGCGERLRGVVRGMLREDPEQRVGVEGLREEVRRYYEEQEAGAGGFDMLRHLEIEGLLLPPSATAGLLSLPELNRSASFTSAMMN